VAPAIREIALYPDWKPLPSYYTRREPIPDVVRSTLLPALGPGDWADHAAYARGAPDVVSPMLWSELRTPEAPLAVVLDRHEQLVWLSAAAFYVARGFADLEIGIEGLFPSYDYEVGEREFDGTYKIRAPPGIAARALTPRVRAALMALARTTAVRLKVHGRVVTVLRRVPMEDDPLRGLAELAAAMRALPPPGEGAVRA
jgi:hypothetical protein